MYFNVLWYIYITWWAEQLSRESKIFLSAACMDKSNWRSHSLNKFQSIQAFLFHRYVTPSWGMLIFFKNRGFSDFPIIRSLRLSVPVIFAHNLTVKRAFDSLPPTHFSSLKASVLLGTMPVLKLFKPVLTRFKIWVIKYSRKFRCFSQQCRTTYRNIFGSHLF